MAQLLANKNTQSSTFYNWLYFLIITTIPFACVNSHQESTNPINVFLFWKTGNMRCRGWANMRWMMRCSPSCRGCALCSPSSSRWRHWARWRWRCPPPGLPRPSPPCSSPSSHPSLDTWLTWQLWLTWQNLLRSSIISLSPGSLNSTFTAGLLHEYGLHKDASNIIIMTVWRWWWLWKWCFKKPSWLAHHPSQCWADEAIDLMKNWQGWQWLRRWLYPPSQNSLSQLSQ